MFSPTPLSLEAAVLTLGLLLFVFEMFLDRLDKKVLAWAAITGLATVLLLSFYAVTPEIEGAAPNYAAFYSGDGLAMFFKRFALLTTIIVLVMSVDYLPVVRKFTPGASAQGGLGEFLSLPVLTCAGLMWMASAVDFVMIFVSLELVTISFYVLVSYTRRNAATLEAGVKYLILSALSTGFIVYGITWVFGITGQTNLELVRMALAKYTGSPAPVLFGFMLIVIALGFKIAAAPFQIWVPDVYQGAPTPVTAFLSVGSKAAGFVVLLRVLDVFLAVPAIVQPLATHSTVAHRIGIIFTVMAALSLVYGNLAAMPQNNLKRLLAYSSVAHAGYLLMAVASVASTPPDQAEGLGARLPIGAISFYLAAYLLMTLLSFVVMIVVANSSAGDDIADFNGLSKRSPYLAFAMLVAMLSLAGLPFTAGFIGKFLVFTLALEHKQYVLVGIGIVAVACGFYYYLKVVRAMYFQAAEIVPSAPPAPIVLTGLTRLTIAGLVAAIFYLGVYPTPALELLKSEPKMAVGFEGHP